MKKNQKDVLAMEFHEKLQELRKGKGLTQEEVAQALFVSRTAISKWESGRGYPNIDSLKAIAKFYAVTIDELLSGEEILTIAQEDTRQAQKQDRDLMFGLLDCSFILFLFLPFFGQRAGSAVQEVSLLALTQVQSWLKWGYFALVVGLIVIGILTLALQNCTADFWVRHKNKLSLLWNVAAVFLFILSRQPYAAGFAFLFLVIKALIITKQQ